MILIPFPSKRRSRTPYQNRTSRGDHQTGVERRGRYCARRDDEGGAFHISFEQYARERIADLKADRPPPEDEKILECLRAAEIMVWRSFLNKN